MPLIPRLILARRLAKTLSSITLMVAAMAASGDASRPLEHPNIIFVLADDLGWAELGCYGNTFNETPHLDQMALDGLRFTQAYAAAPVCSPYRAAFLTGQYPARIGISDYLRPNSANALSTDQTTLAEALQKAGYATGMIGKWHLTGYRRHNAEIEITPREHGFDWDFARELKGVSNGVNFWPYLDRKSQKRWLDIPENRLGEHEFLVDRMNHEAIRFIEHHQDRPFFLYLTHYATHSIVHGKPALVGKYRAKHPPGKSSKTRCVICSSQDLEGCPQDHWATKHNPHLAAMLESIDDGIGLITQKLEELGLTNNTILIFTSDNGGETNVTSNAPLRGGKSQLYEGGIRVPLIVRWPSSIPPGTITQTPTINMDFYPSLLEACGVQKPKDQTLDGVSLLPTWRNPNLSSTARTLVWHYPLDRPHFLGGVSGAAIRKHDWKLIEFFEKDTVELYSLAQDPSETTDIKSKHPAKVKELREQLETWRLQVEARTASPPVLSETRQLYFADHFSSGRMSQSWKTNPAWKLDHGRLIHVPGLNEVPPLELKSASFRDAVIRFDFQLGKSKSIRLISGKKEGREPFVEVDSKGFRLGIKSSSISDALKSDAIACSFPFNRDRWYTMTVEIMNEHMAAHIDRRHFAYARLPEAQRDSDQFAIQAEGDSAMLDNIQIMQARPHPHQAKNLQRLLLSK